MVWGTVSSWSCFCWLYRAAPSLAAKNIINLISMLTIWWCPCVESSLVLLEEGVCYDQCSFLAKLLLVFSLLHSVFQGQICLLLRFYLTEWYMDHIRKTSHGLLASVPCISGTADVSGCGHRLHSRGVGMPGPRSAEIVQERDVRELQEPGLLGWGYLPSRIPYLPTAFLFHHF